MSSLSKDLMAFNDSFQKMYHNPKKPTSLENAKEEYYRAKADDVGAIDEPTDLDAAKTDYWTESARAKARSNQPDKDKDDSGGFAQFLKDNPQQSYTPQAVTAVPDAAAQAQPVPGAAPATPGAVPTGGGKPMLLGQPNDVSTALGGATVDDAILAAEKENEDYAAQAVKAGLEYNLAQATQQGATGGQAQINHAAVAQGANAVDMNLFQQTLQAVDPEGKMSESERNLSAVGLAWDFYSSTGQHDKAQKVAGEMISTLRNVAGRYGAFAQAAAEKGDIEGANKALIKMYAHIPDGQDLKVEKVKGGKFKYTFMQNGKKVEQAILSPTEIAAKAMHITPALFDQFIIRAAGKKAAKGGDGGGALPKSADRARDTGEIDIGLNTMMEEQGITIPVAQQTKLRGMAQQIYGVNNVRPAEAARAAFDLMRVDTDKKDLKPDYKVQTWDGHSQVKRGEVHVKYPGGRTIKVPREVYDNAISLRKKRVAKVTEERRLKAKGEKYRSDLYDEYTGKLKSILSQDRKESGPQPAMAVGAIGS